MQQHDAAVAGPVLGACTGVPRGAASVGRIDDSQAPPEGH